MAQPLPVAPAPIASAPVRPVAPAPVAPPVANAVAKSGSVLGDMFEKRPAQPAKVIAKPVKASEAVAASPSMANDVLDYLMSTIAEKTGFPMDMLSSDMDLENDLAVDSIRRVEILGAVQEKFPNAPTIGPSQLGTLKTIADIVGYLSSGTAAEVKASVATVAPTSSEGNAMTQTLLQIISEKTGFPTDMLSPEMDLENDLAVDSIRRVEILGAMQEKYPHAPSIGPAQLGSIRTIGDVISYLSGNSGSVASVGEEKKKI